MSIEALSIISVESYYVMSQTSQEKGQLVVFQKPRGNSKLGEPTFTLNLGQEKIYNMRLCARKNLIASISGQYSVIFRFEDGKCSFVRRVMADSKELTDSVFDYFGNYLVTGGKEGVLRFWQDGVQAFDIAENSSIKSLDFHINRKLMVIVTETNYLSIINYDTKTTLKRITGGNNAVEFLFNGDRFSLDEQHLLTVQNSKSSASISVWFIQDNQIKMVKTRRLCKHKITCITQSNEGMFLGAGCEQGETKIVNLRYYDFESQGQAFKNQQTNSVCFSRDSRFLVSCGSDGSHHFLPNIRPEGWFSKITKFLVLAMLFVYITHGVYSIIFD